MAAVAEQEAPVFAARSHAGERLPIGPFRRVIEQWLAEERLKLRCSNYAAGKIEAEAKRQIAYRLDVSTRTLYRYRFEFDTVFESIVDRALSRDERLHLYDLYPYLAEVGV